MWNTKGRKIKHACMQKKEKAMTGACILHCMQNK
jgi:hypothetical protein